MIARYREAIQAHYVKVWRNAPDRESLKASPLHQLPGDFCVLEFSPSESRRMWTYATCCMSQPKDPAPLELHLFSPVATPLHVELLTAIAHFHRTGEALGLHHTVNFGRPWLHGSRCTHGLISLPYLDGPGLEMIELPGAKMPVSFLWLIPITRDELDFKKANGVEALERKFEESRFDYLDPERPSVTSSQVDH